MDNERMPKPGEKYLNFNGRLVQIITVATNPETGESMVVYQALSGEFKTFVRTLSQFIGEVDRQSYPGARQRYLYELFVGGQVDSGGNIQEKSGTGVRMGTEPGTGLRTEQGTESGIEVGIESGTEPGTGTGTVSGTITEAIAGTVTETIYEMVTETYEGTVKDTDEGTVMYGGRVRKTEEQASDSRENGMYSNAAGSVSKEGVNTLLLRFLDASSYNRKLEVVTSNVKHLNDRLINDMAVSLDCAIDEGPIDQRIHDLVLCLQAMSRFEDRRFR